MPHCGATRRVDSLDSAWCVNVNLPKRMSSTRCGNPVANAACNTLPCSRLFPLLKQSRLMNCLHGCCAAAVHVHPGIGVTSKSFNKLFKHHNKVLLPYATCHPLIVHDKTEIPKNRVDYVQAMLRHSSISSTHPAYDVHLPLKVHAKGSCLLLMPYLVIHPAFFIKLAFL